MMRNAAKLAISLLCLTVIVKTGNVIAGSAAEHARDYVQNLPADCNYGDGYICEPSVKTDNGQSLSNAIPARYLQAWTSAWQDFQQLTELSDAQKQLMHYKIEFSEEDQQIVVLFAALLMPYVENGKASGISTATFGQSTRYWIDRKTLEITKRLFLK